MTVTFASLGVPNGIARALEKGGIETPFPIQVASLQAVLAGKDLCGRAPTGSGKTLAFAIPVAALTKQAKPKRPRTLILTPTRELAAQIRETLLPLTQVRGRSVATIYGGTNITRDIKRLKDGVDIIVATPGRLEDLISRRTISLEDVDMVVLDEADRMADMGFLPVVTKLLDMTSRDRQTLLFSATLDGDVDVLVKRYQNNPVRVEVESSQEELGDVRHLFWHVDRLDRKNVTADILRAKSPAIVFTRTKRGADRLCKQLRSDGIAAEAIHGDRSQSQRERALKNFQTGASKALIATDVAARGIHVDDVAVVVHYDPPGSDKDYVHRSGRTGRAGAEGVVVSLVHDEVKIEVDDLQRDLALPRGLHALDFAGMSSHKVPDTVVPTRQGAVKAPKKQQGRPQGKPKTVTARGEDPREPRGGNANRTSAGHRSRKNNDARGGGSRGQGGSRQRAR